MGDSQVVSHYANLLSKRIQSLERDRFVLVDLLKALVSAVESNDAGRLSSTIDSVLNILNVVDKNDIFVNDSHEDVYPNIDCVTNSCFLCKVIECRFNVSEGRG